MNKLYFGDCLDVLKELYHQHTQGFIDQIYIDPPFNSKRDYNILFESIDLHDATAQKQAFADTWSNVSYMDTLSEIQDVDLDLYTLSKTLDNINISKSAVAYLTTMALRILYMHKVLKDTGSFYLHCDPTMSHYLKIICDVIFGEKNFRNEIIWHYGERLMHNKYKFNSKHDVILFYAKSGNAVIKNQVTTEWTREGISRTRARKILSDTEGNEYIIDNRAVSKGIPPKKQYINDIIQKGKAIDDVWDFPIITSTSDERLGYPTQKPETLLERIIAASSNEGDLIADFFCGCGTTIAVAQRLKRNWLGVDISHLAIKLIIDRLTKPYLENKERIKTILDNIEVSGLPKDIASAKELAQKTEGGRFGFQDWVIEVMLGGVVNPKKTSDGGWDGYVTFQINKHKEIVLIEVKSGNVNIKNIREFIHVVEKKNAAIGVFVCFMDTVTKPMVHESKTQGYYAKETFGTRYQKIQILTIEDLLSGDGIDMPISRRGVFKSATSKHVKEPMQDYLL